MLDELIGKYKTIFEGEIAIRCMQTATLAKMMYKDLEKIKQFQEKEKQQVFTSEQEKEIRKFIKEQLEIEVSEVTTYDGVYISLNIPVRENR